MSGLASNDAAVLQIGATFVELLRPACGIVVGTNLPPDVRLAGKPAVMGSALDRLGHIADAGRPLCHFVWSSDY